MSARPGSLPAHPTATGGIPAGGAVPRETPLRPSPEQDAIVATRLADPAGSLRVLAFAGTGKTTALRLLAEADATPALYLAYSPGPRR